MSENLAYIVDEEGDDSISGTDAGDRLYLTLGGAKSTRLVPLAFTVPDEVPPLIVDGFSISWTKEAVAAFDALRCDVRAADPSFVNNLPFASLRGIAEIRVPNVTRVEPGMGLDKYAFGEKGAREPAPFIFVEDGVHSDYQTAFKPILDQWITNFLIPNYAEPGHASWKTIERIRDLQHDDGLLSIEPFRSQALPWGWSSSTGTTQPRDKHAFRVLADHAARLIAGKEIFPGLGPMKRVIASRGMAGGMAGLITQPIQLPARGAFSLVVRLEVITFPSLHQPLLTLEVSKRRWVARLADSNFDRNAISGVVFSNSCLDRVFGFTLNRKKDVDGEYRWLPDNAFEAIRTQVQLPMQRLDGHAIARGEADTDQCQAMLTYRESIQDKNHRHGVKAGVPELDKLTAFDNIAALLAPIGLRGFSDYSKVKAVHSKDESASRMINASTLLGAVLDSLEGGGTEEGTRAHLATMSDAEIDVLLRKHLERGLGDIQHGQKIVRFRSQMNIAVKDQTPQLDTLITANREAVARMYPEGKPLLIVFYEDGAQDDLKLLKAVIRVLWGDAVEVLANRLPAGTHGPRDALPGREIKRNPDRAKLRIEAWRSTAKQIADGGRRSFCSVMARNRYPDPNGGNTRRQDDKVNKPATRQALSSIAGASVQFLLPPSGTRDDGAIDATEFFHRAQAAMKDLISAHSGRIDGVQATVAKWFRDSDAATMPKSLIGITIVRKNSGRSRQAISSTFLPIAIRIDVETGRCEMRCAYEGAGSFKMTPWQRFPDALATVSQISPIRLGDTIELSKPKFAHFVERVISSSVEEGEQPLVMIDSSNCSRLWPWLTDTRIDVSKIDIGAKQWMQDEWRGARIVRVRQDLAPRIIEDKVQHLGETTLTDDRHREEIDGVTQISAPTSPTGLFRLDASSKTGCVAYLSVGRKTLHQNKRGPSCYRPTWTPVSLTLSPIDGEHLPIVNAAGHKIVGLTERPPYVDMWPTPNPLEIVVTLRQEGDDPDRLAALVEGLRQGFGHYSEWTTLPAPLFFERVVRDYISAFLMEGEDEDPETEIAPT